MTLGLPTYSPETGEIREPPDRPPSDEAGWVPREMAEKAAGGEDAAGTPSLGASEPPAVARKPRPTVVAEADAAERELGIEEARRAFYAAASELELATHASLHKWLSLPCKGEGNHNDGDPNACTSMMEHLNMLAVDGCGVAGAWETMTRVLKGEEEAPWARPKPEPSSEEAAQAALE